MAKEECKKSLNSQRNVTHCFSQAIKRFNTNSNKYLERTNQKSTDVIALRQLEYRYRILDRIEYEKLKKSTT